MKQNPNFKAFKSSLTNFFKHYGAGVAAAVCAVAVGVTFGITQLKGHDTQSADPTPVPTSFAGELSVQYDLSESLNNITPTPRPTVTPQPTAAPAESPDTPAVSTAVSASIPEMLWPVADGKVTLKYAGDVLVFHETLGMWATHKAIDIAPGGNSKDVLAVMDGTVEKVYSDPLLGSCVLVRHSKKYSSLYASLGQTNVQQGDKVTAGHSLGTVGTSAISESASGEHVHFEFFLNDQSVNAQPFFK